MNVSMQAVKEAAVHSYMEYIQSLPADVSTKGHWPIDTLLSFFWSSYLFYTTTMLARDVYLCCNGKPCHEEALLSDYRNGCAKSIVFDANYRQRGGCFMVSASIVATIAGLLMLCPCTCGTSLIFVPFLLPLLFILPFFCL
jgi:hypothetical protein